MKIFGEDELIALFLVSMADGVCVDKQLQNKKKQQKKSKLCSCKYFKIYIAVTEYNCFGSCENSNYCTLLKASTALKDQFNGAIK